MSLLANHMTFIKKWVSIENIVCQPGKYTMDLSNLEGSRSFLEPWLSVPHKGPVDDHCEAFAINDCGINGDEFKRIKEKKRKGDEDDIDVLQMRNIEPCGIYISSSNQGQQKCVNKARIKYFEGGELAQKITGRNGDEFKILGTIPYGGHDGEDTDFGQIGYSTIYCNILSDGNNLYILFNCGSVFDSSELWSEDDQSPFIKYLDMLFNELEKNGFYDNQGAKLILCGHSMGCVLACRFAYFIKEKNNDFFNNQCIVIGSAPFRWLPEEKAKNFNNLDNVCIFIASDRFGKHLMTDPSLSTDSPILSSNFESSAIHDKINENFTTYLPMFNLINNKKEKRFEITKINEIPTADLADGPVGEFIHMWSNYFKLFSSFENNSDAKNGGRKRKVKKRKSRKKKKKKKTRRKRRKSRRKKNRKKRTTRRK